MLIGAGFAATGALCLSPHTRSRCETTPKRIPAPPRALFERLATHQQALEAESAKWQKDVEKVCSGFSIIISSAPSNEKQCAGRRYRIDYRIAPERAKNLTPEGVMGVTADLLQRVPWDPNLIHAEFLHGRSGLGEPDVVMYRTREAAGGLICSREFVDARMFMWQGDVLLHVVARWDQEASLPREKGVLSAFNVPGIKGIIRQDADGAFIMTNFGQSEIGGWLPAQLLNATVADAHLRFAVKFLEVLGVD